MRSGMIAMLVLSSGFWAFASGVSSTLTITGNAFFVTTGENTDTYYLDNGSATLAGFGTGSFNAGGTVTVSGNIAGPTIGNFTLDFGDGNTMTGTFRLPTHLVLPVLPVGGFKAVVGSVTITGGTGIYAGYTGAFPSVTGTGTTTGTTTARDNIVATGTVTPPGSLPPTPVPGTLPLMVTALGALYLFYRVQAGRTVKRSAF